MQEYSLDVVENSREQKAHRQKEQQEESGRPVKRTPELSGKGHIHRTFSSAGRQRGSWRGYDIENLSLLFGGRCMMEIFKKHIGTDNCRVSRTETYGREGWGARRPFSRRVGGPFITFARWDCSLERTNSPINRTRPKLMRKYGGKR